MRMLGIPRSRILACRSTAVYSNAMRNVWLAGGRIRISECQARVPTSTGRGLYCTGKAWLPSAAPRVARAGCYEYGTGTGTSSGFRNAASVAIQVYPIFVLLYYRYYSTGILPVGIPTGTVHARCVCESRIYCNRVKTLIRAIGSSPLAHPSVRGLPNP